MVSFHLIIIFPFLLRVDAVLRNTLLSLPTLKSLNESTPYYYNSRVPSAHQNHHNKTKKQTTAAAAAAIQDRAYTKNQLGSFRESEITHCYACYKMSTH